MLVHRVAEHHRLDGIDLVERHIDRQFRIGKRHVRPGHQPALRMGGIRLLRHGGVVVATVYARVGIAPAEGINELLQIQQHRVPQEVMAGFLGDVDDGVGVRRGIGPTGEIRDVRKVVPAGGEQHVDHVQVLARGLEARGTWPEEVRVRVTRIPAALRHVHPSLQCDIERGHIASFHAESKVLRLVLRAAGDVHHVVAFGQLQHEARVHVREGLTLHQHVATHVLAPALGDALGVALRWPVITRGIAHAHAGLQGFMRVGVFQLHRHVKGDALQRGVPDLQIIGNVRGGCHGADLPATALVFQ